MKKIFLFQKILFLTPLKELKDISILTTQTAFKGVTSIKHTFTLKTQITPHILKKRTPINFLVAFLFISLWSHKGSSNAQTALSTISTSVSTMALVAATSNAGQAKGFAKICNPATPWACAMTVMSATTAAMQLITMGKAKKTHDAVTEQGGPNEIVSGCLPGMDCDDPDNTDDDENDTFDDPYTPPNPSGDNNFNSQNENLDSILKSLQTPTGRIKVQNEMRNLIDDLGKKGFTIDNNKQTLTTPSGNISTQSLSLEKLQKAGLLAEEDMEDAQKIVANIQNKARKFLKRRLKASQNPALGGGYNAPVLKVQNQADKPFALSMRRSLNAQNQKNQKKLFTRNINGESIGASINNIFEMIHRRYQNMEKQKAFIK